MPETMNNLGWVLLARGNHDEATKTLREALALNRKVLGDSQKN